MLYVNKSQTVYIKTVIRILSEGKIIFVRKMHVKKLQIQSLEFLWFFFFSLTSVKYINIIYSIYRT